jgi:FkbM family methyltransferase
MSGGEVLMKRLPTKRHFRELIEVLTRRTSLNAYLARNFPSFYKMEPSEIMRWKGHLLLGDALQEIELFDLIVEKQIYSIPECRVEEGDVVFDVGAHMGFFSYHAKLCGARAIYAFEPNPHVREILMKHKLLWRFFDLNIYEFALYSEERELDLSIPENPLASIATVNREGTVLEKFRYRAEIRVVATTIDNFIKRNAIPHVDFIKIDAEGSEREILRGAKQTIREFRPKIAVSAYHRPDDGRAIPEIVLSVREDYKFKSVNKGERVLFFY